MNYPNRNWYKRAQNVRDPNKLSNDLTTALMELYKMGSLYASSKEPADENLILKKYKPLLALLPNWSGATSTLNTIYTWLQQIGFTLTRDQNNNLILNQANASPERVKNVVLHLTNTMGQQRDQTPWGPTTPQGVACPLCGGKGKIPMPRDLMSLHDVAKLVTPAGRADPDKHPYIQWKCPLCNGVGKVEKVDPKRFYQLKAGFENLGLTYVPGYGMSYNIKTPQPGKDYETKDRWTHGRGIMAQKNQNDFISSPVI